MPQQFLNHHFMCQLDQRKKKKKKSFFFQQINCGLPSELWIFPKKGAFGWRVLHCKTNFILMITQLFLPSGTSGCLSEVGRTFLTSRWREERKSRADIQPFYIVWQLGLSRPFICQVPAEKSGRLDSLHPSVQYIYISAPIKTCRYATATYFLPSPASAL